MGFSIEYSSEAIIQLEDLEKQIVKRIMDKIDSVADDPYRVFKRLVGRPEYKMRVGDYRVIAEIESGKRLIFIRSVGHRRDIYKKH